MSQAENGNVSFPVEHAPGEKRSHIGILLPGQDVSKMGMFEELNLHPAGQELLERGNEIMIREYDTDLIKLATPTGDPEVDAANAAVLKETRVRQPTVYLYSLGIHNINKYLGKRGYATTPNYYSGISMGMGTAAMLAGHMDFETGFRFHADRGYIMQKYSDPQPTSMVALRMREGQVLKLLGERRNEPVDLCLINVSADEYWVVGGPNAKIEALKIEIKERDKRQRPIDVDTDRAMHGRYVRPARDEFDKMLARVKFKTPVSAVVGSITGLPIRNEAQMKDELMVGFDHTVDNRKPLRYFRAAGIHTFSEVGTQKGNFAKALEALGSIDIHKVPELAHMGISKGVGVYEVITERNRKHPKHNEEEDGE